VFTCIGWKFWLNRVPAYINFIAAILPCSPKTGPLHYCNNISQYTMKWSAIQRENVVKEDMLHTVLSQFQNGIALHGHKQRYIDSVHLSIASSTTVCCMPDKNCTQILLQLLFQTFQKSFEVVFLYHFFANYFAYQSVSSKTSKLLQMWKN